MKKLNELMDPPNIYIYIYKLPIRKNTVRKLIVITKHYSFLSICNSYKIVFSHVNTHTHFQPIYVHWHSRVQDILKSQVHRRIYNGYKKRNVTNVLYTFSDPLQIHGMDLVSLLHSG